MRGTCSSTTSSSWSTSSLVHGWPGWTTATRRRPRRRPRTRIFTGWPRQWHNVGGLSLQCPHPAPAAYTQGSATVDRRPRAPTSPRHTPCMLEALAGAVQGFLEIGFPDPSLLCFHGDGPWQSLGHRERPVVCTGWWLPRPPRGLCFLLGAVFMAALPEASGPRVCCLVGGWVCRRVVPLVSFLDFSPLVLCPSPVHGQGCWWLGWPPGRSCVAAGVKQPGRHPPASRAYGGRDLHEHVISRGSDSETFETVEGVLS